MQDANVSILQVHGDDLSLRSVVWESPLEERCA
jgi:hypothetical protein